MKKLLFLSFALMTFLSYGQELKSISNSANAATKMMDQSSMFDKLAGDQVKKLTKKLNLSDSQQKQVTDLVVKQLKSEKFQKLLGKYSPDQLMGSAASDKLTSSLLADDSFKKELGGVLNEEQKAKAMSGMMKGM